MSSTLEQIYLPKNIKVRVDIKPSQLNSDLYNTIEKNVQKKLSGKCIPQVGYIKPGSVKVANTSTGKYHGTHFTGNMSFHVSVNVLATMPVVGQMIDALVISRTEECIMASNALLPYKLYVPKLPDDPNIQKIDKVTKDSFIRVEVVDSMLRAPDTEVKRSEYWVLCKLVDINMDDIRRLDIPHVGSLGNFIVSTKPYSSIMEDRSILTRDTYQYLGDTMNLIQEINQEYISMIMDSDEKAVRKDPVINSFIQKTVNYALCYVNKINGDGSVTCQCIISDLSSKKRGETVTFVPPEIIFSEKELVLLRGIQTDGNPNKVQVIKFWSNHVRYVVNPYELVKPSYLYMTQLNKFSIDISGQKKVMNRAYYKFKELAHHLIKDERPMTIACLAESPGGFIQAIAYISQGHNIGAISIPPDTNHGTWDKLRDKLGRTVDITNEKFSEGPHKMTKLNLFGDNADGDIMDEETRKKFYKIYEDVKADLVTADGGFYRDKTLDTEEMDFFKLLMAESLMALNVQAIGGHFVMKIYDMATYATIGLISILSACYENVYIVKPKTSRGASSEKYIICKSYRGHTELDEIKKSMIEVLQTPVTQESFIAKILLIEDQSIVEAIKQYNSIYMKNQGDFIRNGREYSSLYMSRKKGGLDTLKAYVEAQKANLAEFMSTH